MSVLGFELRVRGQRVSVRGPEPRVRLRSWDVAVRIRIVPLQLPMLPTQTQVQRGAVTLKNPVIVFIDGDRLVLPIHQAVAG